jgi:hypothetical protein
MLRPAIGRGPGRDFPNYLASSMATDPVLPGMSPCLVTGSPT